MSPDVVNATGRKFERRSLVLVGLALVVTLAWIGVASTADLHVQVVASHHVLPVATGYLLAFLVWTMMAAAMMLPPLLPWILTLTRLTDRDGAGAFFSVPLFVGGYVTVWTGYSAVAAGAQVWVHHTALRSGAALTLDLFAAAVLVAAGVYQFSPLKCGTLAHCRNPLSFILTRWDNGPRSAAGLGFRHGLYCLGCCWALMALSFALGVMNVLWMAVLTLLVCVEKLALRGPQWSRAFGVAFIVWGLGTLLV